MENMIEYLTPIAILFSALVAIIAMLIARKTSREKAAIDFLFSTMENEKYWKAIKLMGDIHRDLNIDIKRYAHKSHAGDDEAETIRYVLNYFEHFAIGINTKIYDEAIIKRHLRSIVIDVWKIMDDYVYEVRDGTNKKTPFNELEALAKRWEA